MLALPFFCLAQSTEIIPTAGQAITQSCRIAPGEYRFDGAADGLENPALIIKGENIEVDFQGATFLGNGKKGLPDQFSGLGIKVEGRKILIKNLNVRGYKIGLLAMQVVDFQLIGADFSYNWRPRLRSSREKEDPADWLDFEQNDHGEWMRHGAGIYLKNCQNALVKNCTATGNQNALLLAGCSDGLFYNNDFRFNSGVGIGLFRSSKNTVMHNRLGWNVRGFSQNFYQTGQGSAGILCFGQSVGNVFGYNSATHSGNGFLGRAGEKPMDDGPNRNLIFGNDFSYAPANGIETAFSQGNFYSNYMDGCTNGIWAAHSDAANFSGNTVRNCTVAMAVEAGQNIRIERNSFEKDSVGIWLFDEIGGAFTKNDSSDRDVFIVGNNFSETHNPLKISGLARVFVDSGNVFSGFKKLLDAPTAADSAAIFWDKKDDYAFLAVPNFPKLADGIDAKDGISNKRGRHWIWMTEWGPYDFRGPICFLKKIDGTRYEFWMNAAGAGNWSVKQAKGFKNLTMTGGFPTKLVAERNAAAGEIHLQFEAVFQQEQTDVFGNKIPAGQPYLFEFRR